MHSTIKYSFLILGLILLSCTQEDAKDDESQHEFVESNGPFEYNQDYSKACNLCLMTDSMAEIDMAHAAFVAKGGKPNEFESCGEELRLQREELIELFKGTPSYNASKNYTKSKHGNYYQEDINIAFEACRKEHPLNDGVSFHQQAQYLFNYSAYSHEFFLRFWIEADSSQLRTPDGYKMKVKGENILIPLNEFEDYWIRWNKAYDAIWAYIYEQRNANSKPLTGKELSSLTPLELLMFESHAETKVGAKEDQKKLIEEDKDLKQLCDIFWKAVSNEE